MSQLYQEGFLSVETCCLWLCSDTVSLDVGDKGHQRPNKTKASPPKVHGKIVPQPTLAAVTELPEWLLNDRRAMFPVCSLENKIRVSADSGCLGTVSSSWAESSILNNQKKRSTQLSGSLNSHREAPS